MEEVQQTTEILVFNRENIYTAPSLLTSYEDMTEVHLYSHDNTLVVLERRAVENMITSIITIDNFKLSLWNSKTLGDINAPCVNKYKLKKIWHFRTRD